MVMHIAGLPQGSLKNHRQNSFFLSLSLGLISHVPRQQVSMTANIKSLTVQPVISAGNTKPSALLDQLSSSKTTLKNPDGQLSR